MKHRYKTKNTLKESAESQEEEKELLQDRPGSSDPKSQEETEEDTNFTSETHEVSQPTLSRRRASRKCSVEPLFVHHSFQETSSQSTVTKAGSVNMEQGIKPSSPSPSEDSDSSSSHVTVLGKRRKLCSGSEILQFEHEPQSSFQPKILSHQGQPSLNYSPCYSSDVFQGRESKQTDPGSGNMSDLLCSSLGDKDSFLSDSEYFSVPSSTFSSTKISADPQPEDDVFEPSRKRSWPVFDHSDLWLVPTSLNRQIGMGQLFLPNFPDSPPSLSPLSGLAPPSNYEVLQTKREQSSDSLAETNEGSEQLTETPSSEVKEFLDLVAPETVFEKLPKEPSAGFLWGAECDPAVNNTDGAAPSAVRAEYVSATSSLPPSSSLQVSSSSSSSSTRSLSAPSLSKISKKNFRRAASLPDMTLQEFTPAISADGCDDETYRFQCSFPGLYQCSVSGLVFSMKGEGDVLYRTVPWNRRLLAQHHKKPAGPLFDIRCLQQSVCQLHLPHCEIISTGGGRSLQVAHVTDEGVEFLGPQQVTQTHVILNISGFSAYGNVKDEDSPPDPVRALVLLFYKPPQDPDLTSFLSVLMLPRNVVLRDVLRTRKKIVGDERYIEASPHCKLHPKQSYTLSTSPEDDSVLVQPTEAEFDEESYDNYFPSFQVTLEKIMKNIHLFLRDSSSSHSVWQRKVYLSSCGPAPLNLPPNQRLLNVRSCFIDGISGPVLSSLLDHLLEKKVITDAEREEADETLNRREKARLVIDTVRRKGEAASSEMMEFLREIDPFFYNSLGLI